MCANYTAVTELDQLLLFFGVERVPGAPPPEWTAETWRTGLAPFIRLKQDGSGGRDVEAGRFGLVPFFAREVAYGRKTYNSRSETVAKLPSFRDAWKHGQRCIIPAHNIYEPCYESGKPVRWSIQRADGTPMGIAGIWSQHPSMTLPDGSPLLSFAMLTINADGHPVFQRMHAPEDEKRMVVILDDADYDRWLTCKIEDAPSFFTQWPGPLTAYAKPLPPRKPRGK